MEDKLVSLLKMYTDVADRISSWKFIIYGLLVFTILILLRFFPLIYDILSNMYNVIMPYLILLWVAFGSAVLVKLSYVYIRRFEKKKSVNILVKQLHQLSEGESKIMQLALQNLHTGIWVAKNNSSLNTLLYKGLLKRISDIEVFEDWDNSGERELCILCIIPEELQQNL